MSLEIWPHESTQSGTRGPGVGSDVLIYHVRGSVDADDVHTFVQGELPAFSAGIPFRDYRIDAAGGDLWLVTANYNVNAKTPTGESELSFDTGGGTVHITQSLETVNSYNAGGGAAPDLKGAIGVSKDSVDGTDIVFPVYTWTETHYFPLTSINSTFRQTLFALTGTTNNGTFKGFATDEVLFEGASGSQRGREDMSVTYRFAASPNVTGLSVGDITGIAKKGWEYLWFRYQDDVDANQLVKRPIAAYVERVYEPGNFANLGIGT